MIILRVIGRRDRPEARFPAASIVVLAIARGCADHSDETGFPNQACVLDCEGKVSICMPFANAQFRRDWESRLGIESGYELLSTNESVR